MDGCVEIEWGNGDIVIGIEFTARSNPRGHEISRVSHSFIELLYTMSWLWSDELLLSSFSLLPSSPSMCIVVPSLLFRKGVNPHLFLPTES